VEPEASGINESSPEIGLDLETVALVRNDVAIELSDLRRSEAVGEELEQDDEIARAEPIIWARLDELARERALSSLPPIADDQELALFARVKADLFGLGGFEVYLNDPTVENIFVNGANRVFVSRSGAEGPTRGLPIAESDDALIDLINRWAARLGRTERRFDTSNPRLDMRLPGGYRLHAIMEVTARPTVTIRCPPSRTIGLPEQIDYGTIDLVMADFLSAAVRSRCNMIVAGGTGTGKTTLLRALLLEVSSDERIITIEDTAELGIAAFDDDHPNVVEMETRQANVEGVGQLNMMDLTRECLRMSPDRVIIGEVRGAEALYMLKAMSQGNDGSMCTLHADSAEGVADRIRGYCAEGIANIPMSVIDGFYRNAVDLVVHLRLLPDRRRVVGSIVEVEKDHAEGIRYNVLFGEQLEGIGTPQIPPSERLQRRLVNAGMTVWPW